MKTKREQLLFDIAITAVEGGISHWAQILDYKWSDEPCWVHAKIRDDYDGEYYTVGFSTIKKGLNRICNSKFETPDMNLDILKAILVANRLNDAGEIDSECADVIVQVGLFGQIIYG